MKLNYIIYLNILFVLVLIVSCSKTDTGIKDQKPLVKVGEVITTSSQYKVQVYSKDSLFVGYNKLFFKVTDKISGKSADKAAIVLYPLMNMVTFSHACPFENPGETPNPDGYFEGAVMFSMPGSDNSWSLAAGITVNGEKDSAYFEIPKVIATTPAKKIVIIDSLSSGPGSWIITKYPVSLVGPDEWKVGNNTFEITVNTMVSMMSFPCCNDFTIEIGPEMPSMGHGSPNNVNPAFTGNGHYSGVVNFTMTGAWRVNMLFRKGGRVIGRNAYFDINF